MEVMMSDERDSGENIEIDLGCSAVDFIGALKVAAPFMSKDATRYYLRGILLTINDVGNLRLVATNGHILIQYDTDFIVPNHIRFERILSKEHISMLCKIPVGRSRKALMSGKIKLKPNYADVTIDGVTIGMNLIDGTYPKYERVVPKHPNMPYCGVLNGNYMGIIGKVFGSRGAKIMVEGYKVSKSGKTTKRKVDTRLECLPHVLMNSCMPGVKVVIMPMSQDSKGDR